MAVLFFPSESPSVDFFTQMLSRMESSWKHKRQYIATIQDIIFLLLDQCSNRIHVYQTHAFMFVRGFDHDNLFLGRFIETCSNTGLLDHAISVFSHKTQKNTYFYNTMIKAFSIHSRVKEAVFVYSEARVIGLRPDFYTIPFLLKGVSQLGLGRGVHCQAIGIGLDRDVHVGLGLIQMYASCGRVCDARKMFDEMLVRDLAVWNAMVSGCCFGE